MSGKPTLYIAHNFAARECLKVIRLIVEQQGIEVTSSWIWDDTIFSVGTDINARRDLLDIDRSETLLVFEEQYGEMGISGKYVEMGYALHGNKNILVMNGDESRPKGRIVFFDLPQVKRIDNIYQAIDLTKEYHRRLYES